MKDNHPIDNLFRAGLASKKMTPPANAWSAIEANVQKKSSKKGFIFYLTIAASVSLVCAFTWSSIKTEQQPATIQVAEVIKQQPEFEVRVDSKPATSFATVPELTSAPAVLTTSSAEKIIENPRQEKREVVRIPAIKKPSITFTTLNAQFNGKIDLDLPAYITEPEVLDVQNGIKFNFIRSLASVAKGVNDGKKALSSMRKSKIEFINEELKFDKSEEDSKVQATIDQDSPSKEK